MSLKKTYSLLYIIGQVIELIGGFLVFRYGIFRHLHSFSDNGMAKVLNMVQEDEYNKPYRRISRFGFILVLIGICLQFPMAVYNYLEA